MDVPPLGSKSPIPHPAGGRAWDRAGTGTTHSPGIRPAGAGELVARGATAVVLSQGMNRQLQVHPGTRRCLEQHSITVHVAGTREAAKIYDDLAEGAPVAGLFHSACSFPLLSAGTRTALPRERAEFCRSCWITPAC